MKARIDRSWGLFATIDPNLKKGTRLPENFKLSMRPVAMSTPHIELIAKILLFAEGFKKSEELSTRLA